MLTASKFKAALPLPDCKQTRGRDSTAGGKITAETEITAGAEINIVAISYCSNPEHIRGGIYKFLVKNTLIEFCDQVALYRVTFV